VSELLPIGQVFMRKDARKIDEAAVSRLVDSITEVGLINPIRVRATTRPNYPEAWEVIAGGHRLRAMRKIGYSEIPAVVVDDDDLHAELAMIDENLMRSELSPADRASQTARRKAIYLELHPETAQGGNWQSGKFCHTEESSFVGATSAAIGKPERTVRLDAERGEKISDQALALVRGTVIDKGTELDKLKKVAPEKQMKWVEERLAQAKAPKPPKLASDPLSDGLASEKQVARLMDAWNAAGPEARQEFLLRIDVPVFDRGANQ
jgi:ParB-like nuclease domain